MPDIAEPLSGFGGGAVVELVDEHDRRAFQAVYTVRFLYEGFTRRENS